MLMCLMVKQLLRSAQVGRELWGAMFDTVVVKNDTPEPMAMSEQTGSYAKLVQEEGRGHKRGPPYIWAWAGLISSLDKRGQVVGAMTAKKLKEYMTELEGMDIEQRCEAVKFCRLDKMYNQELRRITFCCSNGEARAAVLKAFDEVGAERKQGKAPASYMERELQEWVEALIEQSGMKGRFETG